MPPSEAFAPHDPYTALRLPEFRRLLLARVALTVASQIQGVTVAYQIYKLTDDALALGLIGLAEAVPSIVVSLYAGHLADTVRRKRIIVGSVALLVLCALALLVLTQAAPVPTPGAAAAQPLLIPGLYGVLFVSGIARGFLGPALFAFMPQVLPDRSFLANAITWNSTTWQASSVVGPALGSLLFAKLGLPAAYAVTLALAVAALLLWLTIPGRPLPPLEGERLRLGESIASGVRFIFNNQIVLAALSLDLFAVLFGGAVALLPVFVDKVLHTAPETLGYLRAAPAIGSVAMAVALTYFPLRRRAGVKLLWAVAGFGLATIGFALSTSLALSLFLLFLTGVFDSVSVIVRSTLIHTYTPEYMKGRVSAVNNIFIGSSNEIGAFESGAAARLMGTVPSVVFGGIMTLVVVAVTAWKADRLRELESGTK